MNGGKGGDGGNGEDGKTIVLGLDLNKKNNPKEITDGILIGKAQKSDLQQDPFNEWYVSEYNAYKTNPEIINELKKHTKDIKIKLFMGTWCGDSQNQVPDFYKILEEIGFKEKNVTLITMKRDKTTPELFEKDLNITNVPTIIFYKNSTE
ncbi:MAG: thioredoxin family protein [Flavobacterium sp.]|nr:thioredoxin family protein [Flavobacterium sp.]